MRVGLAARDPDHWKKYHWLTNAFLENGHELFRARTPSELKYAVLNCDIVFCGHYSHAGRWINIRDIIAKRRCPVVYWWFDLISVIPGLDLFNQPGFSGNEGMFRGVDIVFTPERNLVNEFESEGIHAIYMPESCPEGMCEPEIKPSKKWDVLTWGSMFGYNQRIADIRSLAERGMSVGWGNCKMKLPGVDWLPEISWDQIPRIASDAMCVLSCGKRNDLDGYFSDSFLMGVASGRPVLRRLTPGIPDGPYFTYYDEASLTESIQWLLDHPHDADELGRLGIEWVMSEHSTKIRVQQAIDAAVNSVAVQEKFGTLQTA